MINDGLEAIIFDFGGVLINIDYQATIKAFESLGGSDFHNQYSKAGQSELFNDIETGKISPAEFIDGISNLLNNQASKKDVTEAWNAMILDVPVQSIELLHKLREKGLKLYLLSNTNAIHIELAYKRWGLVSDESPNDLFDHVYLSHEIGMRKPNKEIFEFVCNNESLDPKKTLFIDDSIQHIEGAKKIGLNTVHLEEGVSLQSIFFLT